jgi:plasmid stability protein
MPELLVRNLDEATIKRLKALAKQHGRSLQGQVRLVLEEAAALPIGEVSSLLEKWQRQLARKRFSDSAKIIRKDRGR